MIRQTEHRPAKLENYRFKPPPFGYSSHCFAKQVRIKRDPRQTFPGEKVGDVRNNSDAGRDKLVQIDAK